MGRQMLKNEAEISITAASADDLLEIGMKYCIGREVSLNLVAAHKWFNLAAFKGSERDRKSVV